MTQGKTNAEKIGKLFRDFAHPPGGLFLSGHWNRQHIQEAKAIYQELLKPENKEWNDEKIHQCLKKYFPENAKENEEFKKRWNISTKNILKQDVMAVEKTLEKTIEGIEKTEEETIEKKSSDIPPPIF